MCCLPNTYLLQIFGLASIYAITVFAQAGANSAPFSIHHILYAFANVFRRLEWRPSISRKNMAYSHAINHFLLATTAPSGLTLFIFSFVSLNFTTVLIICGNTFRGKATISAKTKKSIVYDLFWFVGSQYGSFASVCTYSKRDLFNDKLVRIQHPIPICKIRRVRLIYCYTSFLFLYLTWNEQFMGFNWCNIMQATANNSVLATFIV